MLYVKEFNIIGQQINSFFASTNLVKLCKLNIDSMTIHLTDKRIAAPAYAARGHHKRANGGHRVDSQTIEEQLKEILRQEEELQFSAFTNESAMEIGLLLYEAAKKEGKPVAIDITRHGQCLFHCAMQGTSPDNGEWIRRKIKTANRFSRSSFYIGTLLRAQQTTLEEKYLISSQEFAAHGGAFPIRIRDVGMVGTITVSGLPQKEDHLLVVRVLSRYLGAKSD